MSDPISRRTFMRNASLAAAMVAGGGVAGLLGGCSGAGRGTGTNTAAGTAPRYESASVRVYHWSLPSEAALFVAQEKGYFQKYGITAEMVKISGDFSALKTEKKNCIFQVMPHQFSQLVDKTSDGIDVRVISGVCQGGMQAVATEASGVSAVADLVEKRVAVVETTNDLGQVGLQAALADAGIDRARVEWIPEGSFDVALDELVEGNVDVFAGSNVETQIAAGFFGMRVMYDVATDPTYEDVSYGYLAANSSVYANSELAGRVAAAVDEAGRWISENVVEAAELIQSAGYVTDSKQLLVSYGVPLTDTMPDVYESVLAGYTFGDGGGVAFDRSLRVVWEGLKKAGAAPSGKTVEELSSALGYYAL